MTDIHNAILAKYPGRQWSYDDTEGLTVHDNGPAMDVDAAVAEYEAGTLARRRSAAVARLEERCAVLHALIYRTPAIAREYQDAEAQARAFKAAGYAGTPPVYVQNRIDAAGRTAPQAANDIIARADLVAAVIAMVSGLRQSGKASILAAPEQSLDAAAAAALAAYDTLLAQVRAQL